MNAMKIFLCTVFLAMSAVASASEPKISGVFGLAPVPEGAALAVWVPLESGESVSGVMWYNNDGYKVFPELLAVAGSPSIPSVLSQAVVVGEDVGGQTLGWSEFTFPSAYASETSGLFLVFRLPLDGAFVEEGEGAGVGYLLGNGEIRSWVSTEEGEWGQLSPEYQMAVMPVRNANKSSSVVVLGYEDHLDNPPEDDSQKVPTVASLSVAPNPFNPRTKITFALPAKEKVTLVVFDVRGRKVVTLVSKFMTAGEHWVEWDGVNDRGQNVPSGVYFSQLKAGPINMTGRLTLVR